MSKGSETRGAERSARALRVLVACGLCALVVGCIDFGDPQPSESFDGGGAGGASGGAGGAGGAGGNGVDDSQDTIVTIISGSFRPNEVTIDAGGTVRWLMEDAGVFHFLVEGVPEGGPNEPLFDTPRLDPGDEFTYTFARPGSYTYFCSNHATTMRDAKVVVE